MNKTPTSADDSNIWDDAPKPNPKETRAEKVALAKPVEPQAPDRDFDIEGLMTDFPTAKDLERFVFDETGIVLNLKGRANKMKYQVAMDVLNGSTVDAKFIGHDNPYLDKTDMVPEEPMKELPPRDPGIPPRGELQNEYYSPFVPHSDPEYHAQGRKMHCTFRKYRTG